MEVGGKFKEEDVLPEFVSTFCQKWLLILTLTWNLAGRKNKVYDVPEFLSNVGLIAV